MLHVKQHYALNALSAAALSIVVGGAGYNTSHAPAGRSGSSLLFGTGTAVIRPVHAKSLRNHWLLLLVRSSSLQRNFKIYSINWDSLLGERLEDGPR